MGRKRTFKFLWMAVVLMVLLQACSQVAVTSTPDVEFQDVSLSLSTVNPEEQLHYFDYDRNLPLDIHEIRSWRRYNVTVTELTFASPRGEPVPTLLFEPDGKGPFGGLVLMHGAPGQKENFLDLGVQYARYGFVAIAIDAPQFRSEHNIGHVAMAIIWPRFEERDLEEQSQLIVDLQRAVDLLLSREKVDPDRLVYIGGSYGGAMGGLFAGVETRLKAYVLKVGDGGILEHMSNPDERGYPNHLDRWVNILWPIEPLHYVGRASPAELLFQNGVFDTYVPVGDALRYQQAGSEPKTIMWYNDGHFLPARYYYDHLIWLHQRVGIDSILLKPFFNLSGMIYDRLLLAWFVLTALSMIYLLVVVRFKAAKDWSEVIYWLLVTLFVGPISVLLYKLIRRPDDQFDDSKPPVRALSASLWIVVVTMIGFVVVKQINFVIVFHWRLKLYLFSIVPPLVTLVALWFRRLASRQSGQGMQVSASTILMCMFISTSITIFAFLLIEHLGRVYLHFSHPMHNPLQWFVVMITSVLLVFAYWPLHRWMGKILPPVWSMPVAQPEAMPEERLGIAWYKALGWWVASFMVLIVIQAFYIASFTPIYVSFWDAIQTMFGLG